MSQVEFVGAQYTKKPWGGEYLLCRTESSALWCLSIGSKKSTSFHCHPIKRTGYVVISGSVQIDFMSSKKILKAGEFINFRPGLFHKTTSIGGGSTILEVESPDNKFDLLRLEDASGRDSSLIEDPDPQSTCVNNLELRSEFYKVIDLGMYGSLYGLEARLIRFAAFDELRKWSSDDHFLMILSGSLISNSKYPLPIPQRILGPGDVINLRNMRRLEPVVECDCFDISAILFTR